MDHQANTIDVEDPRLGEPWLSFVRGRRPDGKTAVVIPDGRRVLEVSPAIAIDRDVGVLRDLERDVRLLRDLLVCRPSRNVTRSSTLGPTCTSLAPPEPSQAISGELVDDQEFEADASSSPYWGVTTRYRDQPSGTLIESRSGPTLLHVCAPRLRSRRRKEPPCVRGVVRGHDSAIDDHRGPCVEGEVHLDAMGVRALSRIQHVAKPEAGAATVEAKPSRPPSAG